MGPLLSPSSIKVIRMRITPAEVECQKVKHISIKLTLDTTPEQSQLTKPVQGNQQCMDQDYILHGEGAHLDMLPPQGWSSKL
jgi:hypothetical protein